MLSGGDAFLNFSPISRSMTAAMLGSLTVFSSASTQGCSDCALFAGVALGSRTPATVPAR